MIFVIVPLGKEAPQVINWLWRVFMYTAGSIVGSARVRIEIFSKIQVNERYPVVRQSLNEFVGRDGAENSR